MPAEAFDARLDRAAFDDHDIIGQQRNGTRGVGRGKRGVKVLHGHRQTRTTGVSSGRMPVSLVRLSSSAFGLRLSVAEVVTERVPPRSKTWETIGEPRLLVIGAYRMGFTLARRGADTAVRVAIEYDIPERGFPRPLGQLLANYYARWCTRRMVIDAIHHFAPVKY